MAKKVEDTRSPKIRKSSKQDQFTEDLNESESQESSQTSITTTTSSRTKHPKVLRVHKDNLARKRKPKAPKNFTLILERPDGVPHHSYYTKETVCDLLDISSDDFIHITKIMDGILEENQELCEMDHTKATDEAKQQWADRMTAGLRMFLDKPVLRRLNEREHARVGFLLLKRALARKTESRKGKLGKGRKAKFDFSAIPESDGAASSPIPTSVRATKRRGSQESPNNPEDETPPPTQSESHITGIVKKKRKQKSAPKRSLASTTAETIEPLSPSSEKAEDTLIFEVSPELIAKSQRRKKAEKKEAAEKIHRLFNIFCLSIIVLSLWGIMFMLFLVVKGQAYAHEQAASLYQGIRNRSMALLGA
ncbi:hypothetical protein AA313_de0204370 [Arthrobotrys entomopaga]|nr:hypothetical protein AA313_de0204370 [Arthrobotrys entomopaga]